MLIQGGVLGVSVGSRCSRIGGVLRGDSLFSADGAAGIVWGWWLTGWLVDWWCFSSVCVVVSFWRVVCDLVRAVGRKASCTRPTLGWLLVVGWPARGLYALGGRSRSGKAADSFRQIDDFFCYLMI